MDKEPVINVGGSLASAKSGQYNLDISAILREAWTLTAKSRVAIMSGFMICLFIGMLISLIFSSQQGGIEAVMQDQQSLSLLNILLTLIISPFFVGVEMMGIFHSVGLKTKPQLVFAFLKRASWVAVCALLGSVFTTLGFALLYLPGIYLMVALSLSLPLVVDKQLSPMKAIFISIQATRHQWFKLFAIYTLLFFMAVAATLPLVATLGTGFDVLGIVLLIFAMTYIVPLFYNVKGILYREIFGLQLQASKQDPSQMNTTFSA